MASQLSPLGTLLSYAAWVVCRNAAFLESSNILSILSVPHLFVSFPFHLQGDAKCDEALALRAIWWFTVVTLDIAQRPICSQSTPAFGILVGSS